MIMCFVRFLDYLKNAHLNVFPGEIKQGSWRWPSSRSMAPKFKAHPLNPVLGKQALAVRAGRKWLFGLGSGLFWSLVLWAVYACPASSVLGQKSLDIFWKPGEVVVEMGLHPSLATPQLCDVIHQGTPQNSEPHGVVESMGKNLKLPSTLPSCPGVWDTAATSLPSPSSVVASAYLCWECLWLLGFSLCV